jgi:hypothetical protein
MSNRDSNTIVLQEFVHGMGLMDDNSNIIFQAEVRFNSLNENITVNPNVMIRFDGYNNPGTVTFLDVNKEIDSSKMPEQYVAHWGSYVFVNNISLRITGQHKNPKIGNYVLQITPLSA